MRRSTYRQAGTVADLFDGTLDARRRRLFLNTHIGHRLITAVRPVQGFITVGCGLGTVHVRAWRPGLPVFEEACDG